MKKRIHIPNNLVWKGSRFLDKEEDHVILEQDHRKVVWERDLTY